MHLFTMRESIAEKAVQNSEPGDIPRDERLQTIRDLNRRHQRNARAADPPGILQGVHFIDGPPGQGRIKLAVRMLADEFAHGRETVAHDQADVHFGKRVLIHRAEDVHELADIAPPNSAILVAGSVEPEHPQSEQDTTSMTVAMLQSSHQRRIVWFFLAQQYRQMLLSQPIRDYASRIGMNLIHHEARNATGSAGLIESVTSTALLPEAIRQTKHHKQHRSPTEMREAAALMGWDQSQV